MRTSHLFCIALAAGIGGAQTIQSFPTPYSTLEVAKGPDGALWLTPNASSASGEIGRITTGGSFSQFSPPGGFFPSGPIVTGPDGNLYLGIFSQNQNAIVQVTTSGVSTVFALDLTDFVIGMTVGPDGAIWLAESDRVGRITTAGVYTHFLVGSYYPTGIAAGADGNLWFTEVDASFRSYIGKITPAGVVTAYPFNDELPFYAVNPIAAGPDGNIWFTVDANAAGVPLIAKITPAGVISTFSIPNTSAYDFSESSIAASPDGGLWFTGNGAIGRITTSGTASVYPLSSSSFSTYAGAAGMALAAGPDGAMWFGVYGNNSIGRATLSTVVSPVVTQITPSTIPAGSAATPIQILGSGLLGSSTSPCSGPVTWNGTPLTITSAAAGEIDVTVPANLLGTAGQFTVAVSVNQVSGTVCQSMKASGTVTVTSTTKTGTTTQLTASPNPATAGQMVTLTATVTPTTTGSVMFYDGATSLGTVSLSAGVATMTMAFTAGSHALSATFSGNGSYASSATTPFSLLVTPALAATSITLVAPPLGPLSNPLTLTANVTPSTATGNVNFFDGTTAIGTVMLVGGSASLPVQNPAINVVHTFSASYGGDAADAPSNSAPVTVTITNEDQPSILAGGVVNAASFAQVGGMGSAVAPGSLVAIFTSPLATQAASFSTASLPNSLSGVSVTFNGTAAPMVQVVPSGPYPFVSAQVPFELTPGTVSAVITLNNLPSAAVPVQIVASQPGIFTLTANGLGQAVFVNLTDYTIAAPAGSGSAHPISRGQPAFFYVTGLGALTPSVVDGTGTCPAANGLCNANAMPTVKIGGVAANVGFAGQAPGFPGVMQINLSVPMTAPTGSSVSLVVTSADGTVISNSATIAVQ
jgi:uncharacterized protein (TIGR03437 family)